VSRATRVSARRRARSAARLRRHRRRRSAPSRARRRRRRERPTPVDRRRSSIHDRPGRRRERDGLLHVDARRPRAPRSRSTAAPWLRTRRCHAKRSPRHARIGGIRVPGGNRSLPPTACRIARRRTRSATTGPRRARARVPRARRRARAPAPRARQPRGVAPSAASVPVAPATKTRMEAYGSARPRAQSALGSRDESLGSVDREGHAAGESTRKRSASEKDLFSIEGKTASSPADRAASASCSSTRFRRGRRQVYISSRKRRSAEESGRLSRAARAIAGRRSLDGSGREGLAAAVAERERAAHPRQHAGGIGARRSRVPRRGVGQGTGGERQGDLPPDARGSCRCSRRASGPGDPARVINIGLDRWPASADARDLRLLGEQGRGAPPDAWRSRSGSLHSAST